VKRILAIILSIAILVMAFPLSVFAAEPVVVTDTWDGTTTEPTQTDVDGNIIINTAEEFAWLALVGGDTTVDKTYKIADGIESFNMNGFVGITADSTATDVKNATTTGSEYEWNNDSAVFKGNFNGNGITIYNIAGNKGVAYGGLFPNMICEKESSHTIENVTVKASAFYGYHFAAGLLGNTNGQFIANINKCAIENCYLAYYSGDGGGNKIAASIVGISQNVTVNISNCLTIDNIIESAVSDYSLNIKGGFIGNASTWAPVAFKITNSVSIGTSPYPTVVESGTIGDDIVEASWTNVYTDAECDVAGITTLDVDKMQGDAAKANMTLAWNIDWLTGEDGAYPSIHYGEPIKDPYVWDGTYDEPTETDAEGNIIINTVQEMAWIALKGGADTANKNYKVADDVEYFNMNGMSGIKVDSTISQVEEAGDARVSANQYSADHNWRSIEDSNSCAFQGNFDGNGVTVYNIYSYMYANAGLFPCVDPSTQGTITIKNVMVTASYVSGYHYAGGVVGLANANAGTGKNIIFENCAAKNTRIYDMNKGAGHQRTVGTIVGGLSHNGTTFDNCLAVNNKLTSTGVVGGFFGNTSNFGSNVTVNNSVSVGSNVVPTANEIELGSKVVNTTYTNVYTDQLASADGITTLTTDEMQGSAAKNNMALAWNIDWLAGAEGEYPSINFGEPIRDPYVWDGTFKEPTETDAEGNIIINTVQEMAWLALRGGEATANKNYKVADGVKYFDMNGMSGITLDSTATQVKDATKNKDYLWANDTNYFMGNFDGNGLTVYNINAAVGGSYAYTGLFTVVKPENDAKEVTIKNVAVAASHFEGYHYTGGIVGFAQNQSANTGCVNVDSCATKNCYFNDTVRAHNSTSGLIIGQINHNSGNVSNCLAINNISDAAKIKGGIVGTSSDYVSTQKISDCVVIGSLPYSTVVEGSGGKIGTRIQDATVTNVYTDQTSTNAKYTTLANDKMQGAVASITMDTLDDSIWFFNSTTYPELRVFHNITDGKCIDCGLEVAGDPCTSGHTLESVAAIEATNFTDGLLAHDKCSVCGKTFIDGVEKSAEELVIPMLAKTWNGTFVEPTTTDADGNIVINTPEELAWVALRGGAATQGKNYIVAKDSVFNLNGMDGITPFSTVEDVKAVGSPKANAYSSVNAWCFESDDSSSTYAFAGNFDGNGLIVYNLFTSKGRGAAGLFPVIYPVSGGSVTIKNVTIMASHIGAYHEAAGIVGYANAPDGSTSLLIENCAVKNCYIYDNDDTNTATSRTTATLVGHLLHTSTTVNNCLVVDNELSAQGIIGGLFGNSSNYGGANTVKNVISIGTTVQPLQVGVTINDKMNNTTYVNVYTDEVASADGITTLTTDEMKGAAAADNMNLNWNINWAVGAEGEYPTIIIDNAFYDEWDGTFVEPTKTDAEGNIIISTAEEMAWVALRGDVATTGKNYKVADGIKYFNMNGMAGITLDSTATDVKIATKDDTKSWTFAADGKVGTFYGNFDGNGVIVYNIYTKSGQGYGGLFPAIKPQSADCLTIKNVAVVASYIGGYHYAGGIIGLADAPDTSTKLSIENIIVKNSYMYDNNDQNPATQRTAGVVVGSLTHNAAIINNVFASGNEISASGIVGGLFGNSSAYAAASTVSNVVSIGTGVEPVSVDVTVSEKVANTVYENVYTNIASTNDAVTTLTIDEMNGTNLTLDWSGWFATTGLPEIRAFHDVTSTDNGDGTHSDLCSECGLGGFSTPHSFKDGLCELCGAECTHVAGEPVVENTVNATCMVEGSYELVVYCSVCGVEISRTTETIEIDPNAHAFDNDADIDCNNGCGFVRVSYGDSNGDGEINNKDIAAIMQYINGWEVEIDALAADVNCDGKINNKDYALLMQYINDWDVSIG